MARIHSLKHRRHAVLLTMLFVASYVSLLWLTAPMKHISVTSSIDRTLSVVSKPVTLGDTAVPAESDTSTAITTDDSSTVDASDVAEVEQSESLDTNEASDVALLESPANSEPIVSAIATLQSASNREARLSALNILLLRGRQSSVNPVIVQELKDAAVDPDALVAQQAMAALSEVDRISDDANATTE
jgi:hypothetical protein